MSRSPSTADTSRSQSPGSQTISANTDFMKFFMNYMEQQDQRHLETQGTISNLLNHLVNHGNQSQSDPIITASPRKLNDIEFLIESLSNSISDFNYDVDSGLTFENWYRRFKDFFSEDAKNLDDKAKVRLLLRKLETQIHTKYINFILPKVPSDISFDETVVKLTKIFGNRRSIFNIRFKCFQTIKSDDMSNLSYMGLVNKSCEDFKLSKLSAVQMFNLSKRNEIKI